jgi:hypothetical protein
MVISSLSRQCVLKLKEYSDKKNAAARRTRTRSTSSRDANRSDENPTNNPNTTIPLLSITNGDNTTTELNDSLDDVRVDRTILGRLLSCKPCQQVADNQQTKKV